MAYVGSAGRRLPSSIVPLNAIDPSYLSLGDRLNDQFTPGMASLDGVPLPYPGWVEQMTSCAPSVAQALAAVSAVLQQPAGLERERRRVEVQLDAGEARKALLEGHYALVSYTLSKLMESASPNTQREQQRTVSARVISPFEQDRNYTISQSDTPHVLSAAFVYELPFGRGKRYANTGNAVVNGFVGGWQL